MSIAISVANETPVAESQELTVDGEASVSVTLTATDADEEDVLTFTVVSDPENGTLEGDAPDLTYTPNEDYDGIDSFTFTANDGTIDSEAATISITVTPVNDAPIADAGQPETVEAGATVQLDGSGSTDIDDDPATLTYQWSGREFN